MDRRLLIIPIVHTEADLGSLAPGLREAMGPRLWAERQRRIASFWAGLEAWARTLPADLSLFRVYQDGLPICGRERAIVEDLALKGSANHRLLVALMARGAALEGTESPPLLLQEYEHARRAIARGEAASSPESRREAARLLDERDRFIARRIDTTLRRGEVGLLFIGAAHNVVNHLPPTIDREIVAPGDADAPTAPTPD